MEPSTQLLYKILVHIAGVALIFGVIGIFCSKSSLKNVHFNLRVLIMTYGILWCLCAIGCILFFMILDSPESPPLLYENPKYQVAKLLATTSGYGFRVIETCICFERCLATIYFRNYETLFGIRIFSFFAVAFSLLIGFCFTYLFNIVKVSAFVVYGFLITVETTNFILLHILRKQNRLLRRISNSKRALLTSKYQLIENIRSLNLLFPQATISFVISNFTIVSTMIIGSFFEPNRVPCFLSLYCINIISISIYWIYRSEIFTSTFPKIFARIRNESTVTVISGVKTVKTTLGQSIKVHQTIDEHFNDLKGIWK